MLDLFLPRTTPARVAGCALHFLPRTTPARLAGCALLFVYGSLRRTFDNEYARLLRATADFEREAAIRGRLHARGPYVAFTPDGDEQVWGELYRLQEPERTLEALDDYEGEEYERVIVDVEGAPAWIYRLRG